MVLQNLVVMVVQVVEVVVLVVPTLVVQEPLTKDIKAEILLIHHNLMKQVLVEEEQAQPLQI
jgi:hypothetical protein